MIQQKLYSVDIEDKFMSRAFIEYVQAPSYEALQCTLANMFGDDWKRRYFFLDCDVIDDDY